MKLDALKRKREELEKQIAEAEALEKRMACLATLIKKSGAMELSDDEIVATLVAAVASKKSKPAAKETPPASPA